MRQTLIRIIMALIGCAMLAVFSAPTAEAGCGAGFHPFENLRQRIQDRRAARQGGGASSAGGCDTAQADSYAPGYGYAPQYQVSYPDPVQSISYGTDIPMPAQYAKGAVAIFDGTVWRLQETGAAISIAPQRQSYGPTVVPSGMHAHQTIDGRTIIHGNENLGSASAHMGIASPWIRTAEAGQTVYGIGYGSSGGCPGGQCPTDSGGRGLFRRR